VDRQIQTLAHAFADIMFGRIEISSSTRLQAHLPGQGPIHPTEHSLAPMTNSHQPTDHPAETAPVASQIDSMAALRAIHSPTMPSAAAASATFKMSRTVDTVSDLYREYEVGIGGQGSVRSHYEGPCQAWRQNDTERKHYQRRMVIINAVKALAITENLRETQVALLMDHFRMARRPPLSLNLLHVQIKAGNRVI
jgi:hypothetical protein